jgi:aminoacrylate hydrolase
LKYEMFGRGDSAAPTVVLSAGLGGAAAFWRPQLDALSRRFRVIAYDHGGTGANAQPLPDGYAIRHMAQDFVDILDRAGVSRCHFLGHALGGLVGLEIALKSPDRLASLVLVNAWARADDHTRRCFEVRLALLDHVGPEAYVRAQPIFLYPAAWLSRHHEQIEREIAHGVAHFQGTDNLKKRIGALLGFDVADTLGAIEVPVLVVAARDDILVPFTASEFLAGRIPGAKLWMATEGGHANTVTAPEPVNEAIIAFLEEIDHG